MLRTSKKSGENLWESGKNQGILSGQKSGNLAIAMYCFNIAPLVNDLESPFYLVHGRDPLEGRLRNLQNYCRYIGDQPGWLAVQELWKMWKLHARLLKENRKAESEQNKK